MASCINKNSVEFQTLKKKSGLSEFILESICRSYQEEYGRFPYLDEIPSDSSTYLKDQIKLKDNNSTETDNILNYTNTSSVEEANIELNNQHRDLEIKLTPLSKETLVDVKKRPSPYREGETVETDTSSVNSASFLNKAIENLNKLYGISVISTTTDELSQGEFKNIVVDPTHSAAFIYNGNIYINTDIASVDSPVHELLHLFLGGIRFDQPDLYFDLVNRAESFKGYDDLALVYKNRTKSDINEEIFVTEMAKYLTDQQSQLDGLDEQTQHEISYNTHRLIDTVIKGKWSSVTLGDSVYKMSLRSLAETLNSAEMNNKFIGLMNDAETHRVLANYKSELMEKGELKEFC